MNTPAPKNKTNELRLFLDTIDRHLRSLEVLAQNIEQDVFISMIKSKLPKDVLLQMELRKDPDTEWEVESLRKCLRSYKVARERSEQGSKPDVSSANYFSGNIRDPPGRRYNKFESSIASNSNTAHSAEALVATSKGNGYSDKCRYC